MGGTQGNGSKARPFAWQDGVKMFEEGKMVEVRKEHDSSGLDVILADGMEPMYGFDAALLPFLPAMEPGSRMIFRLEDDGPSTPASPGSGAGDETADLPCLVPCFAGWLVRGSTKESFAIPEGVPLPVGRSDECAIVLDGNASVSRTHMRVRCESGGCYVADLKSRNGTFVNGARLEPFAEVRVPYGSILRAGSEFLRLEEGTCANCLKDGAPMGCLREGGTPGRERLG